MFTLLKKCKANKFNLKINNGKTDMLLQHDSQK